MARKKKESLAVFNKTAILRTANELFMQNGIAKTTMDDIAKSADYSKSTIYVYFKSKNDILNHLIHDGMVSLQLKIKELADAHRKFEDFFFAVCNLIVKMHDTYPVYFEGMTGRIHVTDEDFANDPVLKSIYKSGEATNEIMLGKIQKGIDDGTIAKDTNQIESMMILWFSICGIIEKASLKTEYITYRLHKSREELMQYGFRLLFRMIVNK